MSSGIYKAANIRISRMDKIVANAEYLRELRESTGLSQSKFYGAIGLSGAHGSCLERGERAVSYGLFVAIATLLRESNILWLLPFKDVLSRRAMNRHELPETTRDFLARNIKIDATPKEF